MTQRLQIFMQNTFLVHVLGSREKIKPPLFPRLLARFPILQRIPARIIGMGFRPEHVHSPEIKN
jgi:hypothetical protein